MSEQTNYPKRGCMSDDGKHYTHTDGTAWNLVGCPFSLHSCRLCREPETCGFLKCIEGAYVPSDEEQAACDMARKQIYRCAYMARLVNCKNCEFFKSKKCDARVFLSAHKQQDAWEVK